MPRMNPPSMGTGDYFTVHHYIDGCRPFVAKATCEMQVNHYGFVVGFIATNAHDKTSKGFWRSEAVWVEGDEHDFWQVRDGGYADAIDVSEPDDWNPPTSVDEYLKLDFVEHGQRINRLLHQELHAEEPSSAAFAAMIVDGVDGPEDIGWVAFWLLKTLADDGDEMVRALARLYVITREYIEPTDEDE